MRLELVHVYTQPKIQTNQQTNSKVLSGHRNVFAHAIHTLQFQGVHPRVHTQQHNCQNVLNYKSRPVLCPKLNLHSKLVPFIMSLRHLCYSGKQQQFYLIEPVNNEFLIQMDQINAVVVCSHSIFDFKISLTTT